MDFVKCLIHRNASRLVTADQIRLQKVLRVDGLRTVATMGPMTVMTTETFGGFTFP